jgi:hypothetical protein
LNQAALKVFIENDNLDDLIEETLVFIENERNQKHSQKEKEKELIFEKEALNVEPVEICHTLNDIKGKINEKLMETK